MSKAKRRVILTRMVATAGMAVLSPSPASAETELGGIDVPAYCQAAGYDGARLLEPKPWGWKCYDEAGNYGINMTAACR